MELRNRITFVVLAGAFALAGSAAAGQDLVKMPPLDKTLRASESALVVVDFQNNFAAPKGGNYAMIEKQFAETGMIEKSLKLVDQARKLGIQVIQVTEGYTNEYRELDWGNGATFHRGQIVRQAWKSNDWATQLFDPMKNDKDIVLPDRKALNGFGGNALDFILKSRGARNVAVIGFTSDVCVYATTLGGYDLGYRMYVIPDATVAADQPLAKEMLRSLFPRVSRLMPSDQFLAMFSTEEPATVSSK